LTREKYFSLIKRQQKPGVRPMFYGSKTVFKQLGESIEIVRYI